MYTTNQLINNLEDNLLSIKETVNDSNLPCDKRIEILSEKTILALSNIDRYKKEPSGRYTNEIDLIKERAAMAALDYGVMEQSKEQGTSYDSKSETNIQNNVVTQGLRLKAALDAINRDVENDLREQAYEAVKGYYKTCEELCDKNEPLYDSLDWQEQEQYIYKLGNEIFDREEAAKPVTESSILDKVCDIFNKECEYEDKEELDLDELIDLKDFYRGQVGDAIYAIREYQKSIK